MISWLASRLRLFEDRSWRDRAAERGGPEKPSQLIETKDQRMWVVQSLRQHDDSSGLLAKIIDSRDARRFLIIDPVIEMISNPFSFQII